MREIIARNVVVVGQQKPYMDTFGQWHFPCIAATDSATPADERAIDLQFTPHELQENTMSVCHLCGYAGCMMPYANPHGTPASWHTDCLQRQIEATRSAPVQLATVVDRMVAELEQWRKALVWLKDSMDGTWSLCIVRTGTTLSYVMPTDGEWLVGRGGPRYPSRDAAMRAAEAAFGLPPCRVEGEP